MMTTSQIAKTYHLSRQAITIKIKEGRIKAKKKHGRWFITEKDFLDYKNNRYERYLDKDRNQLVFDKKKGFYSVSEAADFLGCHPQRIYHHLRTGKIPSKRYRSSWVIHLDDIKKYKEYLEQRNKVQMVVK